MKKLEDGLMNERLRMSKAEQKKIVTSGGGRS